jgi:hypothetical protein
MVEHPATSAMMPARMAVPPAEPLAIVEWIPRETALAVMPVPPTEPAVIMMSHYVSVSLQAGPRWRQLARHSLDISYIQDIS